MRSRRVSGTIAAVLSCLLSGAVAAQTPAAEPADAPNQQPETASASAPAAAAEPGSDVRIIRLSQVKGAVQMDRNTGRGYEQAFANLPVVQGAKLKTGEGIAEVEFEDNSTLRLTPETEVDFPKLRLHPTGVTLSTIHVLRGTVYAPNRSQEHQQPARDHLCGGQSRHASCEQPHPAHRGSSVAAPCCL